MSIQSDMSFVTCPLLHKTTFGLVLQLLSCLHLAPKGLRGSFWAFGDFGQGPSMSIILLIL